MANKGDIAFGPASASTNGRPIQITDTASPGTLVHTVACGSNEVEDVELWVSNISPTATRTVYFQVGGTTATDEISVQVRPHTIQLGFKVRLTGTVSIRAYDSSAGDVRIIAFMERWTY